MPPDIAPKQFIAALRTGQTQTTRALDLLFARRRGKRAEYLTELLRKRNALRAPLQPALREAMAGAPLPERLIERCIDNWPDAQKERVRRAAISAIDGGRAVRFTWGLTKAPGYSMDIDDRGTGAVTITALTPRSSLKLHADGSIDGIPRAVAAGRKNASRRSSGVRGARAR